MISLFSYAKINIFLYVLNKRVDGYHNIFSLMTKIDLHDTISIEKSSSFAIHSNDKGIPTDENNIVWKIYDLVKRRYDIPPVKFNIYKSIPWGAGLGGGSSNAETALRLLDIYFDLNMTDDAKKEFLQSVGSDTVFFMSKGGSAYAEGRGEIISSGPEIVKAHLLIVKPPFGVSTKEAYQNVKLRLTNNYYKDRIQSFLGYNDLLSILENDFEGSIFKIYEELGWIKNTMLKLGADGALMSGSGSTIFGLFSNLNKLWAAKRYFDAIKRYKTIKTTIL